MKVIYEDRERMYELKETDEGSYVLDAVCPGILWYSLRLRLNQREMEAYRKEGAYAVHRLALKMIKTPGEFAGRLGSPPPREEEAGPGGNWKDRLLDLLWSRR